MLFFRKIHYLALIAGMSNYACGEKESNSEVGSDQAVDLEVAPVSGAQPNQSTGSSTDVVYLPADPIPESNPPQNPSAPTATDPSPEPAANNYKVYFASGFVALAFNDHVSRENESVGWSSAIAPQIVGNSIVLTSGFETFEVEGE